MMTTAEARRLIQKQTPNSQPEREVCEVPQYKGIPLLPPAQTTPHAPIPLVQVGDKPPVRQGAIPQFKGTPMRRQNGDIQCESCWEWFRLHEVDIHSNGMPYCHTCFRSDSVDFSQAGKPKSGYRRCASCNELTHVKEFDIIAGRVICRKCQNERVDTSQKVEVGGKRFVVLQKLVKKDDNGPGEQFLVMDAESGAMHTMRRYPNGTMALLANGGV